MKRYRMVDHLDYLVTAGCTMHGDHCDDHGLVALPEVRHDAVNLITWLNVRSGSWLSENSRCAISRVEILSRFPSMKTRSTCGHYLEKTIEKTILRILASVHVSRQPG